MRAAGPLGRTLKIRGNLSFRFSTAMTDGKANRAKIELDKVCLDDSGRFDNPWSGWVEKGFLDILGILLSGRLRGAARLEDNQQPSSEQWAAAFPRHKPTFAELKANPDSVQAIWIGHASLLVRLGGFTFLTDPVFSDRCSPFTFMGPKRLVKPAFELADPALPNIDFVLISHNHYDHLDHASVMQLHRRFGTALTWYVPLKLGKWFAGCGIPLQNVVELDWWQEVQHKDSDITVAMTPAQHWSNRGNDRRRSLWGGFAVYNERHSFYFAGDTGYCPVFKQIGEVYGPFDLAAIPIAAYAPSDFFGTQHCNPEEAVEVHKEVKSLRSLGIHCCTFSLTQEPMDEPLRRLKTAVRAAGLDNLDFVVMQHGGLLATAGGKDQAIPALL